MKRRFDLLGTICRNSANQHHRNFEHSTPNLTNMSGWEKLVSTSSENEKLFGAHNERNQTPILEQFQEFFSQRKQSLEECDVLEIASGTGQHAAFLSQQLQVKSWTPTDFDERCRRSTLAWTADLKNVNEALLLDVTNDCEAWPVADQQFDVIYNANMIHISPWNCTLGILSGAGKLLKKDSGVLLLYGPFKVDGSFGAESNEAFDKNLRAANSEFGIRDIESVQQEAAKHGLELLNKVPMPSNNYLMIFGVKQTPKQE
jgi:SAM-dependent methyltransferase